MSVLLTALAVLSGIGGVVVLVLALIHSAARSWQRKAAATLAQGVEARPQHGQLSGCVPLLHRSSELRPS
jgi:hypothetical protein